MVTAPALPAGAAKVLTADYKVPFLAHATMEPMVCTAKVEGDRVDVWTGVQDPLNARSVAAKALDIDVEQVTLTNFLLGGGFGRRLPFTFDYVDLGVRIARAMAPVPVKTIWSRENDIQHDYYRGAALSRHAGALDASGVPLAAHSFYTGGGNGEAVAMPCAIAAKTAEEKDVEAPDSARPVALGAQLAARLLQGIVHRRDGARRRRRSLRLPPRAADRAATFQGGARESGRDLGLGHAAPARRRSRHRHLRELRHDRGRSGARGRVAGGRAQGAHVYAAVDCGDVVHLDGATAQVEGSIIFALSAALLSEITIEGGRVVETNFRDYPMIHLKDAPTVTTAFVRSDAPLGGLGEPCVPPLAPAVTNAIHAATGIRVRELPIRKTPLARA